MTQLLCQNKNFEKIDTKKASDFSSYKSKTEKLYSLVWRMQF